MLPPFDIYDVLVPASVIFLLVFVVCWRVCNSPLAALVAASLKAGVFVAYYAYLFDGRLTFFDDWSYLNGGRRLLDADVGVFNAPENWQLLLATGGNHFLYYLYNDWAIRIFGDHYFAPVSVNIMLTVLIAGVGTYLARQEFDWQGQRARLFFFFLLFHPDLFVWSTVMNGKDILVLSLHVIMLLGISLFFRKRILPATILVLFATVTLFALRFYVPILFAAAFGLVTFVNAKGWKRIRLVMLGFFAMAVVVAWQGMDRLSLAVSLLRKDFVNPVYGFVRFLLTPIPFNTEEAYAFLDIPSLLHWLLMPCLIVGVVLMWRQRTPFIRFFIAYVIVFAGLYAVYGELQGPRHRIQLDFALAVFQFAGLWMCLRQILRKRLSLAGRGPDGAKAPLMARLDL